MTDKLSEQISCKPNKYVIGFVQMYMYMVMMLIYFSQQVYKSAELQKIIVGMTYAFENVVPKPDNTMYVVASSKLMLTSPVDVDEDIQIPLLPEEEPSSGVKRSLQEALISPSKSTISAKVIRV